MRGTLTSALSPLPKEESLPRKILLADDSVTAQNMGRRILSEAGYEVVTVNNGPAALKKLAEQKPDLAILDVYMPGYGGIEVCQRIKENAETAGIPVLLTVGKLEPFKADEARRVRADGHLVKPFEATELLAAMIKLEDKIVPPLELRPAAKAAKAKAADAAKNPAKDRKFGDTDTGWKQRLTIPPPGAKRQEPEEAETPGTAFRQFAHSESQAGDAPPVAFGHEQLSPDITAEEIAAITAAAAAFGNNPSFPESESSASAVTEEEIVAAVGSVPTPVEAAPEPAMEPEPAVGPTLVGADSPALKATEEANYENQAVAASAEPEAPPEEYMAPEQATDAEVAAVLESLAPVNGNEVSSPQMQDGEALGAPVGVVEDALAEVGSSWQSFTGGGTRWTAEEIAVPESEASLILEQEMQKAYAALAEYRPEAASVAAEPDPGAVYASNSAHESAAAESYREEAERAASSPAEDLGAAVAASQELEPASVAAMATEGDASASVPIAEMSVPPEHAQEQRADTPVQEPGSDSAGATAAMAESSEAGQPTPTMQCMEPVPTTDGTAETNASHEESAYAAAAAAGTEFHAISHVEAGPAHEAPIEPPPSQSSSAPAEVDHEHEAELAAAWAHWRQIRETIANPQFTSQVADAAAAGYKEIHQPESVALPSPDAPSAAGESSPAAAADPSAIASIVDSVLAELKPKLVEEIARKLGKEKKK